MLPQNRPISRLRRHGASNERLDGPRQGRSIARSYWGANLPRVDLTTLAVAAVAEEVEELYAFTQAPLHHGRTHHHLRHDRRNLRRPQIEPFVEVLDRIKDLGVIEVRVA